MLATMILSACIVAQYESPAHYIARITASADADNARQRSHDATKRAAKRARVAAAKASRANPHAPAKAHYGSRTFSDQRGVFQDGDTVRLPGIEWVAGKVTNIDTGHCERAIARLSAIGGRGTYRIVERRATRTSEPSYDAEVRSCGGSNSGANFRVLRNL